LMQNLSPLKRMTMNNQEQKNLTEQMIRDKKLRRTITQRSFKWFFTVFLGHYMEYPFAPFHNEMFKLAEDQNIKVLVVMAFRGSAKSTILNLAYILWSILGIQQKKFVVIISKNQQMAKNHFMNLRYELENNDLLRSDLGPFRETHDEWGSYFLDIPHLKAKVIAVSSTTSIRGIKHGTMRPDLIICDDIEDSLSVMDEHARDTVYAWFCSEILPAGDQGTKIVALGNLLGYDSLLVKLRNDILKGRLAGVFKAYPLMDDRDYVLWPGKFSSIEKIHQLKQSMPGRYIWLQEYMLETFKDDTDYTDMFWGDDMRPPPEANKIPAIIDPSLNINDYVISAPIFSQGGMAEAWQYTAYIKSLIKEVNTTNPIEEKSD